ncbi:serum paraoxonase/arylesterase 1-like isoform X1 [Saccostrea echinata]|uniref:serum paraoxonase/arylesterase 1-like isoform X1 n=2 Tax=Saccostrea echinata TaxID=191078 RepID=UPI002A835358|nr:serum paraoxonase/arylesterase 1-like isoform X1 [Saccostrea echinata]XP_061169889.1 serum paraoxonase/arylesterase 1-like isoform X1 [Saccostrea echinata]XP_061169890.1 serum paraoxonase/arylesterase 1-like isoform X1 [Saccostrea echinata]
MFYRILFGIALAVSTAFIIKMVLFMDYHKTLWNHRPGKCHIVEGIDYGSEDMQTTKSGLTFITSGVNGVLFSPSFKEYYKKHNVRGRIMLFNMEKPEDGVKELMITGNKFSYDDFYPHGISVLEDKGKVLLFVVVHRHEQDTVEKFEFLEKTLELKHLKIYSGTLPHVLNDVVATGPDTFYTTDCVYYRDSRQIIETVFGFHFGHVLYYNGNDFIIASEPTYTANGCALSKNGKLLYVASSYGKKVMVFKRESNNRLTKVNEIPLDTLPDNVVVDPETEDLLLGCLPIIFKTFQHLDNPVEPAASQVLMLHMDSSGTNMTGVTELFSDDLELYGSTVATLYKNRMLIGTVLHKMMYCEVNIL